MPTSTRCSRRWPILAAGMLLDRLHADNGQTLGQLCEPLDMTRQAVTKHLKLLEEAHARRHDLAGS